MEMPTTEEVAAAFAEARREQAFWEEHYQRLVQEYPDQFVAVRDGAVVATGKNLDDLSASIEAAGLGLRQVWSAYMHATPVHWVL